MNRAEGLGNQWGREAMGKGDNGEGRDGNRLERARRRMALHAKDVIFGDTSVVPDG